MKIDFSCKYENVYSDIEANSVKIIGTKVNVNTEGGIGEFQFTLTQYMDNELDEAADDNDFTKLGSDLYFKLSMKDPIPELVYSIKGKFQSYSIKSIFNFSTVKIPLMGSPLIGKIC